MKKKQTKKVVKAWGITKDGDLLECYPMSSGVFMKRVYVSEESARNVARNLPKELDIAVVRITITYNL